MDSKGQKGDYSNIKKEEFQLLLHGLQFAGITAEVPILLPVRTDSSDISGCLQDEAAAASEGFKEEENILSQQLSVAPVDCLPASMTKDKNASDLEAYLLQAQEEGPAALVAMPPIAWPSPKLPLCNSTGKDNYLESSAMPVDPNCEDGVQPRFFTVYQRASVMRPPFGSDELTSALQQDFMEHEDIVRRGGLVFDSRFECGNLAKATLMRAVRNAACLLLLTNAVLLLAKKLVADNWHCSNGVISYTTCL